MKKNNKIINLNIIILVLSLIGVLYMMHIMDDIVAGGGKPAVIEAGLGGESPFRPAVARAEIGAPADLSGDDEKTGEAGAAPSSAEGAAEEENVVQPVIVYVTRWCGYCRKAMSYLDSQGVKYVQKDIEKNPAHLEEMIKKTGRMMGVPVIDIDGKIILGYNLPAIKQALQKRKKSS
ncbi:glutaredoxin family protein [Thermodesulfobacteriota bacterium]